MEDSKFEIVFLFENHPNKTWIAKRFEYNIIIINTSEYAKLTVSNKLRVLEHEAKHAIVDYHLREERTT
jgi:uncharacterized HAD superfamily protein